MRSTDCSTCEDSEVEAARDHHAPARMSSQSRRLNFKGVLEHAQSCCVQIVHDEEEMQRQRKIHDQLITKGLEIITDSYIDVLEPCSFVRGRSDVRASLKRPMRRKAHKSCSISQHKRLVGL